MNSAKLLVQRMLARLLVTFGALGCALGILLSVYISHSAFEPNSDEHHTYGAVINILGLAMITIGSYLLGYLRAVGEGGRITLDFTGKKVS